jgi:hypothetical protein
LSPERKVSGKVDQRLVAEVAKARKEGRLELGPMAIQPATEEEIEDAGRDAQGLHRSRGVVAGSIPVTIRMPAGMIDRLKDEAARAGARGYQTLIKQWIEDRLQKEPMMAVRQVRALVKPITIAVEMNPLPARRSRAATSVKRVSKRRRK